MDVALPAPFDRFPRHRAKAEAACRAALADPDVVAMVVTGSFATGSADELSDVDLRVYVRPDAVESVVARMAFHGERRPAGGRRAEAVVGDHGDAFARTVPNSLDPASVLAALREEIDLYRQLADPLLERHGIETAEARTVVLRALDLGLDWTPRST